MKKIALNKESLRKLDLEDLSKVHGAQPPCADTYRPCKDSEIPTSWWTYCF